jgi:hypothetical protein
MGEWSSTIVSMPSADRFASVRACKECGHEEAKVVQSHHYDLELDLVCGDYFMHIPASELNELHRMLQSIQKALDRAQVELAARKR